MRERRGFQNHNFPRIDHIVSEGWGEGVTAGPPAAQLQPSTHPLPFRTRQQQDAANARTCSNALRRRSNARMNEELIALREQKIQDQRELQAKE
jgi:hypothetical protein